MTLVSFTRPQGGSLTICPITASLRRMAHRPLSDLMSPGWARVLAPAAGQIRSMGTFLRAETRAGRPYCPHGPEVLRAFQDPFESVRVLVLGQDPYPTPGHAMGLAFSVHPDVSPLPRSLNNIFTELRSDLGTPQPGNGDLSPWASQGVLLLNTSLTVQSGIAGSHRGLGWESVTALAVDALVARGGPLVAVLWGRDARSARPALGDTPVIESPHPSPLSAHRGFFGSRPFSRANEHLVALGAEPIDWALPSGAAVAGSPSASLGADAESPRRSGQPAASRRAARPD